LTGDKEFNDVVEYILIYSNDKGKKMPFIEEQKTIDDYTLQISLKEGAIPKVIQCGPKSVEIYMPEQYEVISIQPSREGLKKISIRGSIREKNSSGRFFVKYLEKLNEYPPETLFKVPDMGDDLESHRFFYSAPKNKKNGGYYQGMPTSSDVTKKQYPNFYNFEKEYNNVSKQGDVEFRNGKKPEELLKFLIQIFTVSNDIILDYHLGSGTTAAVAHKLGRQYIGLEQLQSQID
jgi:adenine-specific DNA-methyltransferase